MMGMSPKIRSKRPRTIVTLMVVLLSMTVGVAIYLDRVAPFQRTVLMVNDTSVTMDYFLKRLLLSDQAPMSMLQTLTHEAIIKQVAPNPPYNLRPSEAEIDQALRAMASGASKTIAEPEFTEWYRQQLNASQLSDAEFRDQIRASQLRQQLHAYLAERVPTVAEQVHLHLMVLPSQSEAEQVRARLEAGEGFATLMKEIASNAQASNRSGDLGWLPRIALAQSLADVVFDQLGVGDVSQPLALGPQRVIIVKVTDKADAREIEPHTRQ